MHPPIVTLLTDFGSSDHYVGAMKGVMLGICPDARVVDISHDVGPYAIAEAAWTLAQAWTCFPPGAIHLVVVDPGVGSSRRPILAEAAGHYFVAPDNGVLSMVYEADPTHRVREITASRYFRQPVSQTFHGRDIFSPVAAHLAAGLAPAELGPEIRDYVRLNIGAPTEIAPDQWLGAVLKVDRFGNVVTNFAAEVWLPVLRHRRFLLRIGGEIASRLASNYAEMEPEERFVIGGSSGLLEVSMNRGSAAGCAQSGSPVEMELL